MDHGHLVRLLAIRERKQDEDKLNKSHEMVDVGVQDPILKPGFAIAKGVPKRPLQPQQQRRRQQGELQPKGEDQNPVEIE